jgi:phage terminase large subunit
MATTLKLDIDTPPWALPLLRHKTYKGAKGGRGSGKSHFFAELAVEEMVADPDLRFVCIREVQRTLDLSAKSLVESYIRRHGLEDILFEIQANKILRIGGTGLMSFQGMQDHTADSIKSLENFKRCWVEEAQTISKRSLDLLVPTIRADGSEMWFSWNPEQPDDPIEKLFQDLAGDGFPKSSGEAVGDDFALVHVNYLDNPFCPAKTIRDADKLRASDSDAYEWTYLGGYNLKSDSKILAGKYVTERFDVPMMEHVTRRGDKIQVPVWDGPYWGADHGYAVDPRVLIKCWIGSHYKWGERCLYVERESYRVKLDIDRTAERWKADMGWTERSGWENGHDDFTKYVVRMESAEPGTNAFLRNHGVPKIEDVKKYQGSITDGIQFLRSFDMIVIHERCPNTADEARRYSWKVDKHKDKILDVPEDANNHSVDSLRYALAPWIKPGPQARWRSG